ncbi:MAG TPA: TonB-dependent receptor [bacterium]|nr:TonB-dependent receptor [bacterium]
MPYGIHRPFLAWRRGLFFALIPAAAALCAPSHASAEDPVDLGTVTVEESSPKRAPSRDATAAATVIIPAESPDPTDTVPDLLERSAGVSIKRYGGLDDFSAISLRGSTASQVQIYVDDIPLVSASGDLIDLNLLPMTALERVEVYRGGSPGIVPDSTIGGVVLLKTKGPPEKPSFSVHNTAGSFTTYRGTIDAAKSFGKTSVIASYDRFQSEGDFTYLDNNGTTFNTSDDRLVTRENNDFQMNSLFTKVIVEPDSRTRISATNILFNKEQGIPGLGNRTSLTARLETWRDMVAVAANRDFASAPGLSGHADLFFDFLRSRFSDPDGDIGLGVQMNDDTTYRAGANARTTYSWGSHQILRGFVAGRGEFYLPVNEAAAVPDGQHSRRYTISVGAEDEVKLAGGRIVVVPSIRVTNVFNHLVNNDPSNPSFALSANRRSDHQLSAKLGFKAKIAGELYFKGNFYRGFRNPTFSELFGDRGTIVGNPTLKSEEAINFDAGLAFHHRGEKLTADAEAAYFRNRVENLIQFVQTSQFTVRPQNMRKALIQGLEFTGRLDLAGRLSAYAGYTFQKARDTSDFPATSGKTIPGHPAHELSAGAAWSERWLPWFSTKIFSDFNFMSGNYIDTRNLLKVDHRTLLSLGATATFVESISLTFSVKNLLDSRISDVVGYPLPGRSWWGTVEFKI